MVSVESSFSIRQRLSQVSQLLNSEEILQQAIDLLIGGVVDLVLLR